MELKPMLFCDTKTVLSYMEPNFRFNLALKLPSIRKAEKAAPLIINRLELQDNRFVVNETEYKMKVYRQCQAQTNPFWLKPTCFFPIEDDFPFGDPETENNLFRAARGLARLSLGEVNYDFDEYGFKISPDESIQPGDIKLDESVNQRRGPKLDEIDELKYMCPEKSLLPCNHFIRLYVSGSMTQFPYTNMKMYQLMKELLTTFFGNRIGEWTIKKMNVANCVLLRWPVNGRKPIVQKLETGESCSLKLNGIQSIIDSNAPLTSLKIYFSFHPTSLSDYPLLENAKRLVISNHPASKFLSGLYSIQTDKVSFTWPLDADTIVMLIDIWMEKTRPIGVRYSFPIESKINLTTLDFYEVLEISADYMKFEMGSEAVLVVQYAKDDSKSYLTIETVPKKK
ncbi:hypothetical protein B9Z55_000193 [Caenorhabditis nigoni]|uniref:Uncharacterized protein n=2 Tax=Caenorhabditis nigoni TaxID=1611254 RepID=A0A2G5VI09_9PELO|nr:hypothetical protein B9Z55_000193 [Caenorhabditis nigoni]